MTKLNAIGILVSFLGCILEWPPNNSYFVFQAGVTGNLVKPWMWPVKQFIGIMDLVGDKTVRISDAGATEITVDSGMATYRYLLQLLFVVQVQNLILLLHILLPL